MQWENLEGRTHDHQPAYRRWLYLLLAGSIISLPLWWGGGNWLVASVQTNLWSVQYLWQRTEHPLLIWLPATVQAAAPPAGHPSADLWQARDLLAKGQIFQAQALLAPHVAAGDYEALRLQAETLVAAGAMPAAIQVWTQIGAVDDLLAAGRQAELRQDKSNALAAYQAAYTLAPESSVLPLARLLYQALAESATAESLLRDYITAMPNSRYRISWLRELGALYRSRKAWPEAIAIYSQLVAAMPDSSADWVQLGWLYYEQGAGAEQALAQFQQAVTLAPNEGAGYYAIGLLFNREKQYAAAEPWLAQAVEREPGQPWWWLSRAGNVEQAGNRPLALQFYATVQERFPTFAEGHYRAAWAYRQAEKRAAAVAAMEQAIGAMASSGITDAKAQANYFARAGQIYEWAGQLQQAIVAYEQAGQLDPLRRDVQDGLERLR